MNSTWSQFDMIDMIWDNRATELKKALRSGLDVNAITDDAMCQTLLMNACIHKHAELVKILLRHKADMRKIDCDGSTALHDASYISSSKIIKLLIQADPGMVNSRNDIGQTPLMVAAKRCYPRAVKLLLDAGADRKAVDYERGNTVLHWCFTERHRVTNVNATLKLLCHDEIEFDIQNKHGSTPSDYLKSFQLRYPEYALVSYSNCSHTHSARSP